MKRIAIINGGVVANVIAHEDDYAPAEGDVDVTNLHVGPGDLYDGSSFTARAVSPPDISRARFDAIFAGALGDMAYDDVLEALAAVAATSPKTDGTVVVKRALRALNQTNDIAYPISDYATAPAADDLTASFLAVVKAALIGTDPDIGTKIDAGLAAWRAYTR